MHFQAGTGIVTETTQPLAANELGPLMQHKALHSNQSPIDPKVLRFARKVRECNPVNNRSGD